MAIEIENQALKLLFVGLFVSLPHGSIAQESLSTLRLTNSCSDCNFRNQSFPFSDFSGTKLTCVDFSGANLEEANFNDAYFAGSFQDANMRGVSFENGLVDLDKTFGLCSKRFRESNRPFDSVFTNTDLRGANLSSMTFDGGAYDVKFDFSGARLDGANLTGSSFASGGGWNDVSARSVNFSEISGHFITANRANFSNANFRDSLIVNLTAHKAKFSGANFKDSKIRFEIDSSDFTGANFESAHLTGSDFIKSNLTGTSFVGSNLEGADLSNSDLTDADLTDANLTDVKLNGAILCNTTAPDGSLLYTGCPD
jgi:uncharacterized protein YjbI with pentapeptide repeats